MAMLAARGIHVVGPDAGAMACDEFGPGAWPKPLAILRRDRRGHFAGRTRHWPVRARPGHQRPDPRAHRPGPLHRQPVPGRQGHAIAAALARRAPTSRWSAAPVGVAGPAGVVVRRVKPRQQMLDACQRALPADIAVFAAAVADWQRRPRRRARSRRSQARRRRRWTLEANPDILATLAAPREAPARSLVVGFAAETDELLEQAAGQARAQGLRLDRRERRGAGEPAVFGGDENHVYLLKPAVTEWKRAPKTEIAERLVRKSRTTSPRPKQI